MYVRIKKNKTGTHYFYLVECNREFPSKTPSQRTVIYMGRAEKFSEEEINKVKTMAKNRDKKIFEYIFKLRKKNNHNRAPINQSNKNRKCVICGFSTVTHLHHIIPVSEGGLSKNDNLVYLCPNHHEIVHKGLISKKEFENYINQNV